MINRPKINRIQWIDSRIRLIFNFVGVSAEFDEAEK